MKKPPSGRSAFSYPRVIISFAFCSVGFFLAFQASAISSGGADPGTEEPEQAPAIQVGVVTTSMIDRTNKLVGFQGDFTFDERVVMFASEPVQKAGLTSGNWNVSGNVLPGPGPIRTLRISAYSTEFKPLSGEGTLFELRMRPFSTPQSALRNPHSPLAWAFSPNEFIFIDADLRVQKPGSAPIGSVEALKRSRAVARQT